MPTQGRIDLDYFVKDFNRRIYRVEQLISSPSSFQQNSIFETIDIGIINPVTLTSETPNAPNSLTVLGQTDDSVTISFLGSSNGLALYYDIEVSEISAGPVYAEPVHSGVLGLTGVDDAIVLKISGLAPSQLHGVRVTGVSRIGVRGTTTGWVEFTTDPAADLTTTIWDIVVVPYNSSMVANPPQGAAGTVVLTSFAEDAAPAIQALLDAYAAGPYYGLKLLFLNGDMSMGMVTIDTWYGQVHFDGTYIESTFTADQNSNWMLYFDACGGMEVTGNPYLQCKTGGAVSTGGTVNCSAGIRFRNGDDIILRGNIQISGFGTPLLLRSCYGAIIDGVHLRASSQSQYACVDLGSYADRWINCWIDGGSGIVAYFDMDGNVVENCEIDCGVFLDTFYASRFVNNSISNNGQTAPIPALKISFGESSVCRGNLIYAAGNTGVDIGSVVQMNSCRSVDFGNNQIWADSKIAGGGNIDGLRLVDKCVANKITDNLFILGTTLTVSATTAIYGRNAIRIEDGSVVGAGDNYGNIVTGNDVRDNKGSPAGFARPYQPNGTWVKPIHDEGVGTVFGPGNYKSVAGGSFASEWRFPANQPGALTVGMVTDDFSPPMDTNLVSMTLNLNDPGTTNPNTIDVYWNGSVVETIVCPTGDSQVTVDFAPIEVLVTDKVHVELTSAGTGADGITAWFSFNGSPDGIRPF